MKVLKILTLAMCSYLMIPTMQGATKHAKETKYPSYKGMIMAGYQGWFGTPEEKAEATVTWQVKTVLKTEVAT